MVILSWRSQRMMIDEMALSTNTFPWRLEARAGPRVDAAGSGLGRST